MVRHMVRRLPLHPSLQGQLLAWSLGALIVVWLAYVVIGYTTGHHEADELTDGHLASVAAIVLAKDVDGFRPAPDVTDLAPDTLHAHDYQQSLSAVVWDEAGTIRARIGTAPLPPFSVAPGFQTLMLAQDGQAAKPWRVFVHHDEDVRARKVAVLLDMQERDDLADDIAEQIALPGLYLLPLVAGVLILAVRRGLRPLHALSQQVHKLDIYQPQPLQAPPHREFQTMVTAIDLLASRYAAAVRHERETADVFAHELRTPLTSLRLNVDNLRRMQHHSEHHSADFDHALRQIETDTARAAAVMRDLLALARANRLQLAQAAQTLDLANLARRVVAEYGQAALDAQHEISLHAPAAGPHAAVPLQGHPVLLEIALRNLLDNALAHTPAGTQIVVTVSAAPLYLQVCDDAAQDAAPDASPTAPKPAPKQKTAHSTGLGLGHQVVRRIAAAHGGRFEHVAVQQGLRGYRLSFNPPEPEQANRIT